MQQCENKLTSTGVIFPALYDAAFSWDISAEANSLTALLEYCGNFPLDFLCDIGAGTGRFLKCLLELSDRICLVEPDDGMCKILRKKILSLPQTSRDNILMHQGYFEALAIDDSFDCVVLLTDVLSYLWPQIKMNQLIREVNKRMQINGILITDVAIWKAVHGEARTESWCEIVDDKEIRASCNALIYRIPTFSKGIIIRIEELSIESISEHEHDHAYRQSILHAFSFNYLKLVMRRLGFEYTASVIPGTQKVMVRTKGTEKRLMVAFRKCNSMV